MIAKSHEHSCRPRRGWPRARKALAGLGCLVLAALVTLDSHGQIANEGAESLSVACQPAGPAVGHDAKDIQGTWRVAASTLKLVQSPIDSRAPWDREPNESRATKKEVLTTTQVVIARGTLWIQGPQVVNMVLQYDLAPAAKPKSIDLEAAGMIALGVYELGQDTLKIFIPTLQCPDHARGRPESFPEPGRGIDTDMELLVLERVDRAAPAEPNDPALFGTWEVVRSSREELSATHGPGDLFWSAAIPKKVPPKQKVIIDPRKVLFRGTGGEYLQLGGRLRDPSAVDLQYGCAVSPWWKTKGIDLIATGCQPAVGIYKLQSDRLTLRLSATRRPTDFESRLGSNELLVELVRLPLPACCSRRAPCTLVSGWESRVSPPVH